MKILEKWRIPLSLLIIALCTIVFISFSYNLYQDHQSFIIFREDEAFWVVFFNRWLPQGLGLTLTLVLFFNLALKAQLDLRELILESAKKKYRQVFAFFIIIATVGLTIMLEETNEGVAYVISNMILAGLYFFILPTMKKRLMASV